MEKKQKGLMTSGNILKQIVVFSIPLIIGNIFQQLYNAIDSIVVGNYVGKEALAAVGSSAPLISMMIGLFIGFSIGAGVIISQYYGARDIKNFKKATNTCVLVSFIAGIIFMTCGLAFSSLMVNLIGTPIEVQEQANTYLKIYFLAGIPIAVYNIVSGIMRAVGDSKTPLYYLCIASVINIILDILFVKVFEMGISGAAYATLISQTISAVLVIITILYEHNVYMVSIKSLQMDFKILKNVIRVGVPAGIQQSIIGFSNVIVQGYINIFGTAAVAGSGAYIKIDGFGILPVLNFGMAATIFIGQNYGAGKMDRVRKGAIISSILSALYVLIFSIVIIIFRRQILSVFSSDEEVISYGVRMLWYFALFYIFSSLIQSFSGILRGFGQSTVPMIIMVGNLCGGRLLWLFVMKHFINTIDYVYIGYPLTWFTASICFMIYMKKNKYFSKERYA